MAKITVTFTEVDLDYVDLPDAEIEAWLNSKSDIVKER